MIQPPRSTSATFESSSSFDYRRAIAFVFIAGLLLQLFLCYRSWIGGDQINMLRLGWSFATTGELQPFAKMMTGGGMTPGTLLQLLVGIPLAVHPHYQSPLVVIVLFDIVAGLILLRLVQQVFGDRFAFIYLLLYWLSPWRLYHSGFLWEPQYLFLPAAIHLWACWHQREQGTLLHSASLTASLLLAMQLHNSFVVLVLLTASLLIRRRLKLNIPGCLLGLVIGLLPLLPTLHALATGDLPPARESEGFFGKGFLTVAPMLKGAWYWFRLGALDIGNPLSQTVYTSGEWVDGTSGGGIVRIGVRILQGLTFVTVAISIAANWWYLRPLWKRWRAKEETPGDAAKDDPAFEWFRTYALHSLLALVIAAGLSPITLQGWMVIIALHAALLPVAFWFHLRWNDARRWMRPLLIGVVVLQVVLIGVIGTGNSIFRRGEHPEVLHQEENRSLLRIIPGER